MNIQLLYTEDKNELFNPFIKECLTPHFEEISLAP